MAGMIENTDDVPNVPIKWRPTETLPLMVVRQDWLVIYPGDISR